MESVPALRRRFDRRSEAIFEAHDQAMLTLKQIAELAGVSRSTASRVLNDRPGVHPDVRERVLKVMREQGFQPDPVARSLASRRSSCSDGDEPVLARAGEPTNSI